MEHNVSKARAVLVRLTHMDPLDVYSRLSDNHPPSIHHWQLRDTLRVIRGEGSTMALWISGQGFVRQDLDPACFLPCGVQAYTQVNYTPTCIDTRGRAVCLGSQSGELTFFPSFRDSFAVSISPHTRNTVNCVRLLGNRLVAAGNDGVLRRIETATLVDAPIMTHTPCNSFCADASQGKTFYLVGDDDALSVVHEDDERVERIPLATSDNLHVVTQGSVAISSFASLLAIGTQAGDVLVYDTRKMAAPVLVTPLKPVMGECIITGGAIRTIRFLAPDLLLVSHHREWVSLLSLGPALMSPSCPASWEWGTGYAEINLVPGIVDIAGIDVLDGHVLVSSPRRFVSFCTDRQYQMAVCL